MFFVISKIYQMYFAPVQLLLFLAAAGALLTLTRRFSRFGSALAVFATLALLVIAVTPFAHALIAPLENRFPDPPAGAPAPYGIIVLGGALKGFESESRGQAVYDEGERLAQAAVLARRYPDARIVYTGGSGSLYVAQSPEAAEAKKHLVELGVDPSRVILETNSRNTDENARFTAALVHPQPGQRWFLVTSAFHMPRSMGLFEKAGFDVVPYPVAFRTTATEHPGLFSFAAGENIRFFETAFREWMGLVMYRATGRIDRLFPGPDDKPVAARSAHSIEAGPIR